MDKPSFEEKTRFRGLDLEIQTERLGDALDGCRLSWRYFRITIFRVAVESGVINW